MDKKDCPYVISEFLYYIETIKNQSPRTVDAYYTDLRTFFRFILMDRGLVDKDAEFSSIDISGVDLDLVKSITSRDIYEYLHFVTTELHNSPAARSRKISSLRAYFKYMTVKSNKLQVNPTANIDVPYQRKTMPKYLSLEESRELLSSVQSDFPERDYCMLTLFLNCGMRLSELVGINDSDIKDDSVRILGKGNKERIIYLNEACRASIDSYRKARDSRKYSRRDPNALFLSRTGSRITGRRVEQIVTQCLKNAGLDGRGLSTHKLRHTAATLMYQAGGADMLTLKEILGHAHVSTTEIYTHINNERIVDALKANPLSKEEPPEKSNKEE
jgi:integrase/recombinase XerC